MKDKLGVIHGRFQGLHLGHMEYLLAGVERCDHLLVGVSNYDPTMQKPADLCNLDRARDSANPFTFYERMVMLRDSLVEAGVARSRFDVVPFPIEFPDHICNFVPQDAVYYMTIYDSWGEHKRRALMDLGLQVEVMWVRNNGQRLTSGTELRDLIASDQAWTHLVPPATARFLVENGLDTRLRASLTGVGIS